MWHRVRLEVSVAAAVAIAIAALVLAIRDGGSEPASVVQENGAGERSVAAAAVPAGAAEVEINVFAYDPDPIRVPAGTTIAWKNIDGGVPHTVTAQDGSFDSGVMEMGDTYSLTLNEPGAYVYICTLHPPLQASFLGAADGERLAGGGGHGMKGTIIVE